MSLPKPFPSPVDIQRVKTLRKYELLYSNDQQSVLLLHELIKKQYAKAADLIYLAHAIPSRVSEFYGDFVQGDADKLTIKALSDTEQGTVTTIVNNNDLHEKVYDWAVNQSEYGYTVLLGRVEEGDFFIDEISTDQYFPQPDGSVIFATYKKDPANDTRLLLYTQHYRVDGKRVVIERKAWETDADGIATQEIALQAFGVDALAEETIDTLDELPIVQIDNSKRTRWGYGKSDYSDIMPQLSEINERATHISTALLKNLDAKMQVPPGIIDDTGKMKSAEAFEIPDKDTPEPKYIINENPLLADTREHIMFELKMVSWITGVPMFELLKSAMPERVEALRMELFSALRKTDTKRRKISRALKDMMRIGFKMLGETVSPEMETGNAITVAFSDVLPVNRLEEAQIEEIAIRNGITSRKSSMQRLYGFDEDMADKELQEINSETVQTGAVNPQQAPTL